MSDQAKRKLVLGLLAQREGLVTYEQLVAAARLWLTDRTRSLEDILVAEGALQPEQALRLAELAARQAPAAGLSALQQDLEVIALLRAAGDVDVEELFTTLLRTTDKQAVPPPPEPASARRPGETRFRVLRPHAKGGLGEVYVARDAELHRDVALKEIQTRFVHDDGSRARFVLEAEITGGLEHPGIVPVYGLGHYPDGRPYYAMRFIQGDSLKEAIEHFHARDAQGLATTDRNLELRQLLKRFVDVCQAIAYAHSRGVLHRDLKPANIMLGKYGETLVVDWGLAKAGVRDDSAREVASGEQTLVPSSGSGVAATLQGNAFGTPAYMPPEQAAGDLPRLGPASDVYSLGATLYHLLVGRAPIAGRSKPELVHNALTCNFPRPRSVRPEVPPALESICLRAMAREPQDRYSSPQALAAAVERYLADEPVAAHPESRWTRARRWTRKHPALTATSAAVVLLSALGLGTFSAILGGKNRQLADLNDSLDDANRDLSSANDALDEKNTALEESNTQLRDALTREQDALALARTNEGQAREQSQLALSTLSAVVNDIQDGLRNLSGGDEVRRRLLATALKRLEEVATEYVEQSAVDHETIRALLELGDVVLQFGGSPEEAAFAVNDESAAAPSELTSEERDAVSLARLLFDRAHDLARQAVAAAPTDAQAQRDLSVSLSKLGDVQLRLGDPEAALRAYEESHEIFERLAEAAPTDALAQRYLCISLSKLGDVQLRQGDLEAALRAYEESLEITQRLAAAAPTDAQAQRDLAISLINLCDMQLRLGDLEASLRAYEESHEVFERLAAAAPTDALAQRDLAVSLYKLGDVQLQRGDLEAALRTYEESWEICERLAAAAPTDALAQRDLVISLDRLGDVQLRLGDPEAALRANEKCRAILERLAAAAPTDAQAQRDLAVSHAKVGDVRLQLGDSVAALRAYEECREVVERLAAAAPTDAQAQWDLSISLKKLGDVRLQLGDSVAALRAYEESREILERLAAAAPTDAQAQRDLAMLLGRLGEVQLQLREPETALRTYEESLAIAQRLAAAAPMDAQVQRGLAISLDGLGDVRLQLGEPEAALRAYEESREIRERLAAAAPTDAQAQRDLMYSNYVLGELYLQTDDLPAARAAFEQAAEIVRAMIERGMNVAQSEPELQALEARLELISLAELALREWDVLLGQPAELLPDLLAYRAQTFARRGEFSAATQAAAKLLELDASTADQRYNAACAFALAAASVQPAEGAADLAPGQTAQRQAWLDAALAALRSALAAGFNDRALLAADPNLAILHDLPEFQELLAAPAAEPPGQPEDPPAPAQESP